MNIPHNEEHSEALAEQRATARVRICSHATVKVEGGTETCVFCGATRPYLGPLKRTKWKKPVPR